MAKKFLLRGKGIEEISEMNLEELSKLFTSRERRALRKGMPKVHRKLIEKIRKSRGKDKLIRTHARDMVILPEMVGAKIGVHNGHEFQMVIIDEAMIGHRLGEFAATRGRVKHSSPGLGATRSSKFVPLK